MVVADMALTKTLKAFPTLTDGQVDGLIRAISAGNHPRAIARRLYPDNARKRNQCYKQLRHAALYDDRVAAGIFDETRLEMVVGLPKAGQALSRRAWQRNVQAIKLLLEATGVHNPRIKHEHSGEISIKFVAPRPTFETEDVVDATVVDE